MSTADKVLAFLQGYELKRQGNEWRCNSPIRPGSNSHAFALRIDDDEHGAYTDHVSGDLGSLYALAKMLNIALPERERVVVPGTKRDYRNIEDYATAHGITADVLRAARWRQDTLNNRPCLIYETRTGERVRFLNYSKDEPTYRAVKTGYKPCWYGMDKALMMTNSESGVLVFCNGEISTVVGQHYQVPAIATTGGEKQLSDTLLNELAERARHCQIWIAMDCDATGDKAARLIASQLEVKNIEYRILDLGLGEKGDLADVCRLHGMDTPAHLRELAEQAYSYTAPAMPEQTAVSIDSRQLAIRARDNYGVVMKGTPIINPFRLYHELGGFAKYWMPGKISIFAAPSGHGKTAKLETISDMLNKAGDSGVWYGREWSPEEYLWRRITRYTGISYDDFVQLEIYKADLEAGILEKQNRGRIFTPEQERAYFSACDSIEGWQGTVQYYHAEKYLDEALASMSEDIARRRKQGERVTFGVFDYIQMYKLMNENVKTSNMNEHLLGKIKDFVIDNCIHGLVGTQVTKDASKQNKGNKLLGSENAQFVRDDMANLFVTLNVIYEPSSDPLDIDEEGNPNRVPTPRAIANVVKNSAGKPGKIRLMTRFDRFTWLDRRWTTYQVDLGKDE